MAPERRQTHYGAIYTVLASTAASGAPLIGAYLLSAAGMVPAFELAAVYAGLGSAR